MENQEKISRLTERRLSKERNVAQFNNILVFMDRVQVNGKDESRAFVESLNWLETSLSESRSTIDNIKKEIINLKE